MPHFSRFCQLDQLLSAFGFLRIYFVVVQVQFKVASTTVRFNEIGVKILF